MAGEPARCRLYLLTPASFDPAAFRDLLAAALDGGDVACLQLRLTGVSDGEIRRAIDLLMPLAVSYDVAFLLEDRPGLARAAGCDGVHLGQQGTPYAAARALVGRDAIIGVACQDSRHLAITAAEAGADYVSFGTFYPSTSVTTEIRAPIELVGWWNETMTVPSVAIGGITPDNCGGLVRAGADFIAAISAVWTHPAGPGAAVRDFNRAIGEALSDQIE
jgi:thiamine-phosphate pyrophosphorylase